ncbi:P-loop containing nucleoside triphosphate hydrolase protein [Echria macrotheca]|uniref:P-loop containing nucleoside triphosphate hydrolase protein n=1 Tax=Echria macrotheca TaxID=438768 RepID=A0AAJ0B2J4_9PEZI|nr:P-loop containing nucleoside triphosphate hydrolase protein [Echria macrotheca]
MREELGATVAALGSLHLAQKDLFDTVDELRSLGVGRIVDLPQIVVCGQQSAGKSSVLEAISRVRFPVKSDICTRFATELILRTDRTAVVDVSIEWQATKPGEKTREEKLPPPDGERDIPAIIEEAAKLMGVGGAGKTVSPDVLRIRVSAPDVPNLTLVDLPGFYSGSGGGQRYEDIPVVNELARRYLSRSNTIILAVVGARQEIHQQRVLDEAKVVDPKRERTIGVITQLDKLDQEETEKYFQLATGNNETARLKYDWHLVRNRSPQEASLSADERDAIEASFLSSGVWAAIPEQDKGIKALREKLSTILSLHIAKSLPSVVEDMKRCAAERSAKLERLGNPRSDPRQLKEYLVNTAEEFGRLARESVQGMYMDRSFFGAMGGASDGGNPLEDRARKLRALIRDLNRAFVTVMHTKGQGRTITWEDGEPMEIGECAGIPEYLDATVREHYQIPAPGTVKESVLKVEMERFAAANQGCEFPGEPNFQATLQFFHELAAPWRKIAESHLQIATTVAYNFTKQLLEHVFGADEETRDRVLADYVEPYFDAKRKSLETKLQELLPRQAGYAIAHEYEFERRSRQRQTDRINHQIAQLEEHEAAKGWEPSVSDKIRSAVLSGDNLAHSQGYADHLGRRKGVTKSLAAAERMIDNLVVYYEISLRNFTENIVNLAVENELVCEIPKILSPGRFAGMSDEAVVQLAAESQQVRQARAKLSEDLDRLTKGIALCASHVRRKKNPLMWGADSKAEKPLAFGRSLRPTVEDVE